MPEIGMQRVAWRELETGSRISLAGHEVGNPGYRQGMIYRVTAPALDPGRYIQERFHQGLDKLVLDEVYYPDQSIPQAA